MRLPFTRIDPAGVKEQGWQGRDAASSRTAENLGGLEQVLVLSSEPVSHLSEMSTAGLRATEQRLGLELAEGQAVDRVLAYGQFGFYKSH